MVADAGMLSYSIPMILDRKVLRITSSIVAVLVIISMVASLLFTLLL
jgi:hypothetical protein